MAILEPFNPAFRGAGSPGAPGVGSTRRGLQLVEQGENTLKTQGLNLERAEAAQPNVLKAQQQQSLIDEDKRIFESIVPFAHILKGTPDSEKRAKLVARGEQLVAARLPTAETEEAIHLIDSGNFAGLGESLDQVISIGQQMGIGPKNASDQEKAETGLKVSQTKKVEAETKQIEGKLSATQQKVKDEGVDPVSIEGFKRAKELHNQAATDPSRKPSDQQAINKANDAQLASAGFANRLNSANEILEALELKEDFDPTSIVSAALRAAPGGNIALSSDQQLYSQAKEDFITAVLRKESGAVISDQEFTREDRKFFPQVGDKAPVLKQKQNSRARSFDNLKKQSKGVYDAQFNSTSTTEAKPKTQGQELKEGDIIRNPTTKARFQVTNGELVPIGGVE